MASLALSAPPTLTALISPSSLSHPSSSYTRRINNIKSEIRLKSNSSLSFPRQQLSFNPLRCSAKSTPSRSPVLSMSSSSKEPLWKSFGKSIQSIGKKPSIEDVLKQQIEKQEYYDGGGDINGPGGGGGGGGGGFGGPEEEGFSGIIDETIQVILATLGFIFLYVYIINGAEMTRLAKDFIKFLFGGRKSVRLTRALYQWERFRRTLTEKKEVDRFWLEKAIINTPTWWDSPDKYKRILSSVFQTQSKPPADDDDNDEKMSDAYPYGLS